MSRRSVKMVSIVLCLISLFVCVPVTDSQSVPNLSPLEKEAVLVLHNLLKASPGLASNINQVLLASNQSDQVVKQLTQGVTENPLTEYAIKALIQGIGQLQSQPVNLTEIDINSTEQSVGNETSPALQNFIQGLQNQVISAFTQELIRQVSQSGSNIPSIMQNGQIDPTALLSSVDPVVLLQNTVGQLDSLSTLLPNNASMVSQQCYEDIVDTIDFAAAGKDWALQMIDALGKPSAGIERGSFYFKGSYDECYMAKPHIEKGEKANYRTAVKSKSFGTRFCRADINIDTFVNSLNVDTRGYRIKLIWGMCVPDTCHKEDMRNLFKLGVLDQVNIPVENVYCVEDKGLSHDKSAIAAISILAFFGFLLVTGTLYDVCKSMQKNKGTEQTISATKKEQHSALTVELKDPPSSSTNDENVEASLPPGYVHHRQDDSYLTSFTGNGVHKTELVKTQQVNGAPDTVTEKPQTARKTNDPVIDRLLLCFSIYTNIPRLLNAKSSESAISCIHGIRFLSLTWVVLGHTYNYGIVSIQETFTASNLLDYVPVIQRFTYQAVIGGGYAVDTFFVLSAFLMTWLQLKETAKRKKKCTVGDGIMFYFHRFWRLTPIYMIVIMTFACLYPHIISGPFAPSQIEQAESCKSVWWTNFLYVNNLVEVDRQCLGWSWYLANDMQFYVVSPIFLAIMYLNSALGAISGLLLMALGIGIAFWKEHVFEGNFFAMLSDGGKWWQNVYTVPWCRVHCWAVGMLLGLIIYKRGRKPLRSKLFYAIGWLIATGVALFLVYIPYTENKLDGTPWNRTERAFYESFGRTAWGACIAWVIFACYTGWGGIANSILSWNGFIPLSRLTYATYLVHPICMMTYIFNRRNMLYINDYNIIYLFLGHLAVSHMVAFVCSVAFEAPFMQLEKVLFRPRRKN